MSEQYPGGYVTKSPPTVTTSSAPGLWTLSQQAQYKKSGTWPSVPVGWMGAFTTGDTCVFYDLQIDSSGNIYAVGWDSTASAMIVAKTDNTGVQQWVKTYSIPSISDPAGLVGSFQCISYLDSSNNLFFGFPCGYSGGGMIKINSSGVVQANMYVNPGFLHIFVGMKGSSDTPTYTTTGLSTTYYWSGFKFNNSLSLTSSWSIFPGPNNPGAYCVGIDSNGAIWGSGQSGNGNGESLIAKGASSFYNRYYQTAGAAGYQAGGCVMVGDSSGNMYHTPALSGYYIIKWTTSGTVSWAKEVTGSNAQTNGGCMDLSGNLNLIYYPYAYNGGQLLRLDSSGSLLLQQRFSTSTNCIIYAIKTDPNDGSLVMVGNFGSTPRAMILRIPSTGAAGASWTVGGATLSCATSTVFSLSSVSFSTASLSQNSTTPANPTTQSVTTSTLTPTWSKYG